MEKKDEMDHARIIKVDRVACPWLIKKFVDKSAEFIFVPADKVMAEAKRLDAIPYDVKNVELGHHGKECSFEAILKKYKLANDPALVLLGKIVNATIRCIVNRKAPDLRPVPKASGIWATKTITR
ncbi:MAG: chromate resistance protein ChrB domain-containing protein [Pseudolabrys sp.]